MASIVRINIGLNKTTVDTLKSIAKQMQMSVSQLCAKYVQQQLEYDEDAYYMKIIEERKNEATIPAEKVWEMLHLDLNL
jgi:uncharacterized protein YueI